MRKRLPDWAPADTSGHFLKYADEQSVVAVAAVDQARKSLEVPTEQKDWAIIAAPRFIGRLGGVSILERFCRGGGPAISPHTIPQHSLHSVSGALSILFGSHGPNFGVGGSASALSEGFLAALTFPFVERSAGIWLIGTAWDPEPTADSTGRCTNNPTCYAAALALQPNASSLSCGQLKLSPSSAGPPASHSELTVMQLSDQLNAVASGRPTCNLQWRLSWGGVVSLEIQQRSQQLAVAA
jgi:hypothetical protein